MKRKLNIALDILCTVCFGRVAAVCLHRAFSSGRGYDGIVGFIWLAAAVVWAVRAVREFREKTEETTDETDHV